MQLMLKYVCNVNSGIVRTMPVTIKIIEGENRKMKKALVIVLALVMVLSVIGLVSCSGKTYEGEYKYYSWGNLYGCHVSVTVQGGVITKVVVAEDGTIKDADGKGMHNLSPNWTNNPYGGPIEGEAGVDTPGKTNWLKYGQAMAESFVGLTTKEVLNMKVFVNAVGNVGEPITGKNNVETVKYIPEQLAVVIGGHGDIAKDAGATQSSARLILAVQDALLQAGGDVSKNPNCVSIDLGRSATAYGLVHGKGYVGYANVTVKNGAVTAAEMDEACLPTYVRATSAIEGVTVEGKFMDHGKQKTGNFYKTIKFADVTMTYDATIADTSLAADKQVSKGYMVGGKTMLEFFADEANCQKYFDAVAKNEVKVAVTGGDDVTIMCAATLLKTQNGYWGTPAVNALGWTANVQATINYVKANGFDNVTSKDDLKHADGYNADNDKIVEGQPVPDKLYNEWFDKNGVATGATWSDMWDYVNLLHNAFNKIK